MYQGHLCEIAIGANDGLQLDSARADGLERWNDEWPIV
jgi:hypothetical protein